MAQNWSSDVFLSYSHADAPWAERVNSALKGAGPGRRVFFDSQSLRAGDDWEATIEAALEGAQNFVLLWSDAARASDWVQRELFQFMASAKPRNNPNRRLICLNLQGANAATKVFQHINHAGLQAEYLQLAAPGAVPSLALLHALQEIENGLDPERRLLEVPLVVLTLTGDDVGKLEEDSLTAITQDFGLTGATLAARYGATRREWRPFDGAATIETLMHDTRIALNAGLPGRALAWRLPPDEFWNGGIQAAQEFVDATFKPAELSVLVVDPVALQRRAVYQRLMLFQDRLANCRTTILALPPFAVPVHILGLRTALMTYAVPYFDNFFKTTAPPHRRVAAQCGWNVSDPHEMRRLILAAADEHDFFHAQPERGLAFVQQQARP